MDARSVQVPTLNELAARDGFSDDFPEIARLLRGSSSSSSFAPAITTTGLAKAALGNARPGIGLAPPSGLAANLVRGAPIQGDFAPLGQDSHMSEAALDRDVAADKRLSQLCGQIRRAEGQARLASTLQNFIGVKDQDVRAEMTRQESRWVQERDTLVRGLERDLRSSGYRTTSHRFDSGKDVASEPVNWMLAADHGEYTSKGNKFDSGKASLAPKEMAAKIASVSLTVASELRNIAKLRAQDRSEDRPSDHGTAKATAQKSDHGNMDLVSSMRSDELEMLAKAAMDKEALLRNMRLARMSAIKTSRAREQAEISAARASRMRIAHGGLVRVAVLASSVDEPRLACCVQAARDAAQVERERFEVVEDKSDATQWAKASYTRDRALWAVQHEFEAALRETAECREYLKTLFAGGAKQDFDFAAIDRLADPVGYATRQREEQQAKLEKRNIMAQSYMQSIEAQPWASMTVQTPQGPAWVRFPAGQYPVTLSTSLS